MQSARRIDEEQIQFILPVFLGRKTNEIVLEIDEWIRQGQREDGQHFSPETCHRVPFMGGYMKFRFHQRHQKEVKRYFCKTRKEMHLTSGSSSKDTSCDVGPGSEKTWSCEKYPDNPKRKMG